MDQHLVKTLTLEGLKGVCIFCDQSSHSALYGPTIGLNSYLKWVESMGESSNFSKSWTFEIQFLKLALRL